MPPTSPTSTPRDARALEATCPHCHKEFEASIDRLQPLRLQGSKCPNCKLFVPARVLAEQVPGEG